MLLIAHRGASVEAPENTIPAFERALAARADGIELDLRITRDGRLVVVHDDDASSTTDGSGIIEEMTFEQVRTLDAGHRAGWTARLSIPTLEEVLTVTAGRTRLYLELKGSFRDGVFRSAAPVARALASFIEDVPDVTVSSFDPLGVAAMREALPGVRTGLGCLPMFDLDWCLDAAVAGGHEECHVPDERVDGAFVARAHAAGRSVLVWTVNDPARMRALATLGVDGAFTDDPAAARRAMTG